MQSIGCTLIYKDQGISCDLSLTHRAGTEIGRWDRLKAPVRPPGKYANNLNFGDGGDLIQSRDTVDGKDKSFLSIYDPGAYSGPKDNMRTPPIVHIFCGSWDTVIERVSCGGFLTGKAILFRSRVDLEFELWYGCG